MSALVGHGRGESGGVGDVSHARPEGVRLDRRAEDCYKNIGATPGGADGRCNRHGERLAGVLTLIDRRDVGPPGRDDARVPVGGAGILAQAIRTGGRHGHQATAGIGQKAEQQLRLAQAKPAHKSIQRALVIPGGVAPGQRCHKGRPVRVRVDQVGHVLHVLPDIEGIGPGKINQMGLHVDAHGVAAQPHGEVGQEKERAQAQQQVEENDSLPGECGESSKHAPT